MQGGSRRLQGNTKEDTAVNEPTAQILHGSNLDVLPTIADVSIDAIVTDPPYELGFMGKKWDASGIAYNVDLWRECLRVLKPGGHLLAFGGTRTYHRMAVAIEDAGFEIRDSIHWLYGSGFPKSLDVSKAIDKRGGATADFAAFRDAVRDAMKRNGITRSRLQDALGNHMLSHYLTAGSQPAIPNWRDYQIIRNTVGLGDAFDHLFRDEAEREVVGKRDGAEFVFAPGEARTAEKVTFDITAPATDAAKRWDGWGTALKPAHEPIVVARKPLDGTVAANVLQHGTGALNIDGCRIEISDNPPQMGKTLKTTREAKHTVTLPATSMPFYNPSGRWPANVIIDDTIDDDWARYFYCAKPSRAERNAGLDGLPERHKSQLGGEKQSREGLDPVSARFVSADPVANIHPTVKPIALMRYLVRLITPPDGTVLDPFAGSGTTLAAAILEGFNSIGIELTDEYLPIIEGRIQWAHQQTENNQPTLFDT